MNQHHPHVSRQPSRLAPGIINHPPVLWSVSWRDIRAIWSSIDGETASREVETPIRVSRAPARRGAVHRCDSRWHARVSLFTLAPYRARLPVATALSPFSPAPAASRRLSSRHSPDNVIHSALLAVNQLVTSMRKSSATRVSMRNHFLFLDDDSWIFY